MVFLNKNAGKMVIRKNVVYFICLLLITNFSSCNLVHHCNEKDVINYLNTSTPFSYGSGQICQEDLENLNIYNSGKSIFVDDTIRVIFLPNDTDKIKIYYEFNCKMGRLYVVDWKYILLAPSH